MLKLLSSARKIADINAALSIIWIKNLDVYLHLDKIILRVIAYLYSLYLYINIKIKYIVFVVSLKSIEKCMKRRIYHHLFSKLCL